MQRTIKKALLLLPILFAPFAIWAQTVVNGIVRDANSGDPMPFVSVAIKGTTSGTTTDVNGRYELATNEQATKLVFTFLGYLTETRNLTIGQTQTVNVVLKEDNKTLDEVVIKPKKEKYRNKNNPAVELIRQVIAHKDQNRTAHYQQLHYQEYEKMQMAINNTPEALKKNPLFKKYKFVLDNVDTTRFSGKALLPLYIEENISEKYFQKEPEKKKTIVTANKHVNFDDRFINNESISGYLKHLYQDVDLYENNLYVVTNSFLSPIADMAPTFYKFYITDTVSADGIKLVELSFFPRNKNDLLFQGKLYVTLDGNFGVQKAVLGVSKDINLNWVTGLDLTLDFERNDDGKYHPSKTNLLVNFGVFQGKKGLFGERTITIRNFDTHTLLPDSIFKGPELVKADSLTRSESYWQTNRPEALTDVEAQTYTNMDSLSNMKSFKRLASWATLVLAGYKDVGPVEIGPVSTFYSYNPVEGFRLRFGGRTTTHFSKRFYTEAYGAYGFKDQRWKCFISGTYSVNNKSIYSYPLNYFRVSYQQDVSIPGQDLQFVQEDNVLLSLKRGVNDKYMYNNIFRVEYVYEFGDHMGLKASYKNHRLEAAGGLSFVYADAPMYNDTAQYLTTSEFGLEWRWAPHEQFFQRKLYRTPIPNAYPIFTIKYGQGVKGLLGGEYNYQSLRGSIYKRLYLSQLGLADIIVNGGYIHGKVPYPLLDIAKANQTYAYQLQAYSLMNFLEFVSDRYASLNIDYHMYGFLLNKIPLFKALKLREVATFKLLYGGVRAENRPENDASLFRFPIDKYGVASTYSLEKEPYMEVSVGVENIFNLIRVDLVKRLSYLNHPNVAQYGIRARVNFDF
ncbi:MAG: DUF5686 family protein [Edaphocola sp.]